MLPEPIASVLRSGRERYNARFAAAKRRWPEIDAESFAFFLESFVAPIVTLAEHQRAGCAVVVTEAAFDVALDLVGQRLAGNQARQPAIHVLWAQVLGPLAKFVALDPARVLPALNNAAHHVASTSGARSEEWLTQLARLGPQCATIDDVLRLGQVLAWRAGLAHFRRGGLDAANALPPALALAAVGAPPLAQWNEIRAQLETDPWFDPRTIAKDAGVVPKRPRVARCAGAFRGFDGLFLQPPRVVAHRDHLLVRSGDDVWVLCADGFGATLHRATPEEAAIQPDAWAKKPESLEAALELNELAGWGDITGAVQLGRTLAITGSLTHQIALVAI